MGAGGQLGTRTGRGRCGVVLSIGRVDLVCLSFLSQNLIDLGEWHLQDSGRSRVSSMSPLRIALYFHHRSESGSGVFTHTHTHTHIGSRSEPPTFTHHLGLARMEQSTLVNTHTHTTNIGRERLSYFFHSGLLPNVLYSPFAHYQKVFLYRSTVCVCVRVCVCGLCDNVRLHVAVVVRVRHPTINEQFWSQLPVDDPPNEEDDQRQWQDNNNNKCIDAYMCWLGWSGSAG